MSLILSVIITTDRDFNLKADLDPFLPTSDKSVFIITRTLF